MTSIYKQAVSVWIKYLNNLNHLIDLAVKHCEENNVPHEDLLNATLAPDMRGFVYQVQSCSSNIKFAVQRISGVEMPVFPDDEKTFEELKMRIKATIEMLEGVDPKSLEGVEDKEMLLQTERMGSFHFDTAQHYLSEYAIPCFHFHMTTAYGLLRLNGVPVGAMDYMKDDAVAACYTTPTKLRFDLLPSFLQRVVALHPLRSSFFRVLTEFRIPHKLEPGEEMAYAELASRWGFPEDDGRRFIRAAITQYIFEEPRPDHVRHNTVSAAIQGSPELTSSHPEWQDPSQAGYALLHGQSFFDTLDKDPRKARWFAEAMTMQSRIPSLAVDRTAESLGWTDDCPKKIVNGGRAEVYIFRTIFHDWPDEIAAQILRNQISTMKAGTRILINNTCGLPPGPATQAKDQHNRAFDIIMKNNLSGKERTREDWETLLKTADSRFEVKDIKTSPGSDMSIIEVPKSERRMQC
ncbi:hypothetical protein S40288_09858 [Stachybotrys chartarum IBT 40288]|nr:hypothetical protein S40288_09858 [Stachybotrys chartarum IBT 40288]